MQFHFHANQSHFHKNGFALRLALKQRHKGTRKWPILKAKDTRALGTSLLIIPELRALVLTKRHVGSGNEIEQNSVTTTRKVIVKLLVILERNDSSQKASISV